jgi:hypothetical protein
MERKKKIVSENRMINSALVSGDHRYFFLLWLLKTKKS